MGWSGLYDGCPTHGHATKHASGYVCICKQMLGALEAGSKITQLRTERDEARQALRDFGQHSVECAAFGVDSDEPCDCGLDAQREER